MMMQEVSLLDGLQWQRPQTHGHTIFEFLATACSEVSVPLLGVLEGNEIAFIVKSITVI